VPVSNSGQEFLAGDLDPTLTEPHLSARTFAGLRAYFDEHVGAGIFDVAASDAGLPPAYLREYENWVSADYSERLSLRLVHHLAADSEREPGYEHPVWQHWRLAGKLAVRRDIFGPLLTLARTLRGPATMFSGMSKVSQYANKITTFTVERQGPGITVLRVGPVSGAAPDRPEYCWSRVGVFESVPTIWGYPEARVEHHECMHSADGASECVYVIRYRPRFASGVITSAAFGLLAAGSTFGLAFALGMGGAWAIGVAGFTTAVALMSLRQRQREGRARWRDAEVLQETLKESERAVLKLREEGQAMHRLLLANQKISGYLNPAVVTKIMAKPERALVLGGTSVHAAVLFLDIVGYTTRSEGRDPAEVVAELNRFFEHVDPVLDAHGGVLDKRIGDAIMAVFLDRETLPAAETRALACAVDVLRATHAFNQADDGPRAELRVRIGVSAGNVVQGNIGSPLRYEYTVIGDIVNLAARLEEAAQPGHILTLETLREHVPPSAEVVSTKQMAIRGRREGTQTLELRPRGLS
jgi:class 3 adenylate cyclase